MKNEEKGYIYAQKIAKAPCFKGFFNSLYEENCKNDFFDDEYGKFLDMQDDWRHA